MTSTGWKWARRVAGALILAVIVWRLGTGPFVTGVRRVNAAAAGTAVGIAVITTVCSAYRWRLVARGLGVRIGMRAAVAAYYRAQFLNAALPGGVLGDVHRGIRQGKAAGDLGRGIRVVVWERCAGQVVQIALAVGVLAVFASPDRVALLLGATGAGVAIALGWLVLRRTARRAPDSRYARSIATAADELRRGVFTPAAWPGILAASVMVVIGHTATFLIAARAVGVTASMGRLLPLALVVLIASALPLNVGGWGPREGVAAWIFAGAGLGAAAGVATATAYGVLVIGSAVPGAIVLIAAALRRDTSSSVRPRPRVREEAAHG